MSIKRKIGIFATSTDIAHERLRELLSSKNKIVGVRSNIVETEDSIYYVITINKNLCGLILNEVHIDSRIPMISVYKLIYPTIQYDERHIYFF